MVFHRSRRKINKGNILLDTTILSQVTFTKFLEVILDDKLKWTHHISYIKKKIEMYGYYTNSQKGSEKEGLITAIPFICDSISNILFGNFGECI